MRKNIQVLPKIADEGDGVSAKKSDTNVYEYSHLLLYNSKNYEHTWQSFCYTNH